MSSDNQSSSSPAYVSRAGAKLHAALAEFEIDPAGYTCADLGCNTGGFTDCLLKFGAKKIYAIDTGYGVLEWKLRKDERVVVMERTNALHVELPESVDLVVIDVAWTRQHLILQAAKRLLSSGGRIVSLIKPHYEAERSQLNKGVLSPEDAPRILQSVFDRLAEANFVPTATTQSPIVGRKGNLEYLALFEPHPTNA